MVDNLLKTQNNLELKITTPLKEPIILDRLDGVEQISTLYCFSLEFHSTSPTLDLSELVGHEVQISFNAHSEKRYFCGIIGEAEQGLTHKKDPAQQHVRSTPKLGSLKNRRNTQAHQPYKHDLGQLTLYRAKLYPKLWLLKFTEDYRIFQGKSALDIILDVLKHSNIQHIEDKTTKKGMVVRDYCVQYGESDFDFVSRLMEEEGIFYFFKHTGQHETLVLCNDQSLAVDVSKDHIPLTLSQSVRSPLNEVQAFNLQEQVVVNQYSSDDFNFEKPKTQLYRKAKQAEHAGHERSSTRSGEKGPASHVYRYPGKFAKTEEAEAVTNLRLQELEWFQRTVMGTSTAPAFLPMTRFSLSRHPRPDANRPYVLYRVHHRINQNTQGNFDAEPELIYENEFTAFPDDVPFRAPIITPKPRIYSTQTAIVTGKKDEEIWCDEYGRIKVKFHWDQSKVEDEKSSCWIRVAQLWSASGWGSLFTPRIGMEVVVTYLDGDPDRPLVTGCVYNGDNIPPYAKDEPTKSTIKSNTSKEDKNDKKKGFNEFRFEDKKDHEEIFIHAQKDMNTLIIDSRTLTIETGDDTTTIKEGNRKVTLLAKKGEKERKEKGGNDTLILDKGNRLIQLHGKGDGTGNHTLEIDKGNDKTLIKKGNQIITLTEGNREQTLDKGDETITIKGKRTLSVKDAESHTNKSSFTQKVTEDYTLNVTGNLKIKVNGNITIETPTGDMTLKAMNIKMEATSDVKIKGGMNVNVEAGMTMKAKAGLDMKLESTGNFDAKGSITSLKGSASTMVDGGLATTVKGTAVTVNGSGTAMIKGGVVMIN